MGVNLTESVSTSKDVTSSLYITIDHIDFRPKRKSLTVVYSLYLNKAAYDADINDKCINDTIGNSVSSSEASWTVVEAAGGAAVYSYSLIEAKLSELGIAYVSDI